jgi:hypothetical protein
MLREPWSFLDPQLRHFHGRNSERSELVTVGDALQDFCAIVYEVMRTAVGRNLSRQGLASLDDVRERFEKWSADHIVAEILHDHAQTRSVMFGLNDRVAAMQSAACCSDRLQAKAHNWNSWKVSCSA